MCVSASAAGVAHTAMSTAKSSSVTITLILSFTSPMPASPRQDTHRRAAAMIFTTWLTNTLADSTFRKRRPLIGPSLQ